MAIRVSIPSLIRPSLSDKGKTGLLPCAAIFPRAVHTKARQVTRSLLKCCLSRNEKSSSSCLGSLRGLTFTWWGCYGSCLRHKPTELAHSFYSVLASVSAFYGPFNCISFHKFSRQLSAFSLCSSGLTLPHWSFQLYISL